jgi:hypothetical protein
VWTLAHFVRNRPAKYPPIDEAISCIRISQVMAVQPTAEADAPAFAHGEITDKPIPVPKARSASDKAAATNAPAITARQETPKLFESSVTPASVNATISTDPPRINFVLQKTERESLEQTCSSNNQARQFCHDRSHKIR